MQSSSGGRIVEDLTKYLQIDESNMLNNGTSPVNNENFSASLVPRNENSTIHDLV